MSVIICSYYRICAKLHYIILIMKALFLLLVTFCTFCYQKLCRRDTFYALEDPVERDAVAEPAFLCKGVYRMVAEPAVGEKPHRLCYSHLIDIALEIGGAAPIAYNAADEVAVAAFMEERISFKDISRIVGSVIEMDCFKSPVFDYSSTMEMDRIARKEAEKLI